MLLFGVRDFEKILKSEVANLRWLPFENHDVVLVIHKDTEDKRW